jgi:membrane protein YqaA with SNARE-associated domain
VVESQVRTKGPLRRLYDWVLHWSETPYALPALFLISFAESSFFPIPPDVLLIALVLGSTTRWWRYAAWCTVASVLGGMAGYAIGMVAWETVGIFILENIVHVQLTEVDGREDIALPAYLTSQFGASLGGNYLFQVYDKWNAWIVFVFGLTPLPYKLVTISAGVAQIDFLIFLVSSILSRGLRFFVVAWLLGRFGGHAKDFIDRYFGLAATVFVLLLIGGFVVVKLVLSG